MYILERIIGIITYMLIMLIMVYLIYKSPKEKLKKILIIYLILLFIMAYFYIPAPTADLYRLRQSLDIYSNYNIEQLSQLLTKSNIPSYILYTYIIAKIGIINLFPAITCLIFYGIVFTILYKSAKKFNLSNKSVSISLLFFMETGKFLEVISGIRTMLAFSIIALCCYNEFIENKSIVKDVFYYLIASFLHPAAMALTIVRFFYLFLKKEKNILKKIFNYIILIFLTFIMLKWGAKYLEYMLGKVDIYLNSNVYSYMWEYIISWIFLIFSSYCLFTRKNDFNNNPGIKALVKFNIYINIIILLFNFEYSIFSRFQAFSSIIFIPILSIVFNEIFSKKSMKNRNFIFIFIFVSILLFFIVGIRGNLSGYKYLLF